MAVATYLPIFLILACAVAPGQAFGASAMLGHHEKPETNNGPTITLAPSSGPSNNTVLVTGVGWAGTGTGTPGGSISFTISSGKVAASTCSPSSGAFSCSKAVSDLTNGSVVITAHQTTNGGSLVASATYTSIPSPNVTSEYVTPASAIVNISGTQWFNWTINCNPSGCPAYTQAWAVSGGIGTVRIHGVCGSAQGCSQVFTASGTAGSGTLYSNVTWANGTLTQAIPIVVQIPNPGAAIDSVSLSPGATDLAFNGTQLFVLSVICSASGCPTYALTWSLPTIGVTTPQTCPTGQTNCVVAELFKAGDTNATGTISATVTTKGNTITVVSSITVSNSGGSSVVYVGPPLIVYVAIGLLLVILLAIIFWPKGRSR